MRRQNSSQYLSRDLRTTPSLSALFPHKQHLNPTRHQPGLSVLGAREQEQGHLCCLSSHTNTVLNDAHLLPDFWAFNPKDPYLYTQSQNYVVTSSRGPHDSRRPPSESLVTR